MVVLPEAGEYYSIGGTRRTYRARAPAGRHVEHADDGQPSSLSFLNQRIVLGARVLMSAADPQPDRTIILGGFGHCTSSPVHSWVVAAVA